MQGCLQIGRVPLIQPAGEAQYSVENPVVEVSGYLASQLDCKMINRINTVGKVMCLKFRDGSETKEVGGKGNNFINAYGTK